MVVRQLKETPQYAFVRSLSFAEPTIFGQGKRDRICTSAFTVHAAKAGASRSTTVDLSNTYQAWTARNFALNGIDGNAHTLERAQRALRPRTHVGAVPTCAQCPPGSRPEAHAAFVPPKPPC